MGNKNSNSPLADGQGIILGKRINNYYFEKKIGCGGCSIVFLAKDINIGESWAIKKIFKNSLSLDGEVLVYNNHSWNSSFLVHYHQIFCEDEFAFIVMSFFGKGTLGNVILQKKKLLFKEVITIIVQLLLGLFCLHTHRVVHRDLKPGNIFLDDLGNVKIGDFGSAAVVYNDRVGVYADHEYTLEYAGPEYFKEKKITFSVDVWALGVCLYELLSLTRPFSGTDSQTLIKNICQKDFSPISNNEGMYPQELLEFVYTMLRKNPLERPTIFELLRDPLIREEVEKLKKSPQCPDHL